MFLLQVVDFKSPGEIQELIDLKVYDEGTDDGTILALCRKVLDYSVHTGTIFFASQLHCIHVVVKVPVY